MLRPPLTYVGTKYHSTEMVLPYVPLDIEYFVEACCGSCGISLGLAQSRPKGIKFICSDLDTELIAFYNELKNRPEELISSTDFLLSKPLEELKMLLEYTKVCTPSLYYIKNECLQFTPPYKYFSDEKILRLRASFESRKSLLWGISEVIQDFMFIRADYKDMLEQYKDKNAFFFLDPPYKDLSTRQTEWYTHNILDMGELYNLVKDLDNVVVSYNESPIVQTIFKDFELKKKSLNSTYRAGTRFDYYYYKTSFL